MRMRHACSLPQVYEESFYGLQPSVSPSGRRDLAVIDLTPLAVYIPPGVTVTWTLTPLSLVGGWVGGRAGGRAGGRVGWVGGRAGGRGAGAMACFCSSWLLGAGACCNWATVMNM